MGRKLIACIKVRIRFRDFENRILRGTSGNQVTGRAPQFVLFHKYNYSDQMGTGPSFEF
jgi:hypothetical protein